MIPLPNFHRTPQIFELAFHQRPIAVQPPGTVTGPEVIAGPPHGHPLQNAMQLQQPASGLDSGSQATPATTPTAPTQRGPVPHQEHSRSISQEISPVSFQGNGLSQQARADSNMSSNLELRPGPLDADNLRPQFLPYTPQQSIANGNGRQETGSVSTLVQSPPPYTQYEGDPAQPMALQQQFGHQYPQPHGPFPMVGAAVPSAELNAFTNSQDCQCGEGCDCVFCATHPYNAATRERVQDLTQIMAMDNYWAMNPASPLLSGHGGAPTNGTNIESVVEQGYPPLEENKFSSAPFEWTDAPVQDPSHQATFDEEASADNGGQTNGPSPPTMRNSGYFTMEYRVKGNCTDATGTCLCGNDCMCSGCITHQGHSGLPN